MLEYKGHVVMATVCCFQLLTFMLAAAAPSQSGITVSIFANNKQQLSNSCIRMASTKPMTLIRCSAACGVSPGCKSFACVTDSLQTCQCHLCFQGLGQMRLIKGGTPPEDCGLPPAVRNTVVTYSSIQINSTVTYTCQATYTYITGTTTARCQDDGTWTKASVICTECPTPILIPRTKVMYADTNYSRINYTCLDSDIYISGTTSAICLGRSWETVSILCASSTCWFYRPGGLPAYKGNVSTDVYGRTCNAWTDSRNNLGWATSFYTDDANYLVDGNRTAASNYCRLFLDNYWPTWCFVGSKWNNCAVPLCPNIPGQLIV